MLLKLAYDSESLKKSDSEGRNLIIAWQRELGVK